MKMSKEEVEVYIDLYRDILEKMYEELLLGDNPQPTDHSRIMRAQEAKLSWAELSDLLETLDRALADGDAVSAMRVVRHAVPDYVRSTPTNAAILERDVSAVSG